MLISTCRTKYSTGDYLPGESSILDIKYVDCFN